MRRRYTVHKDGDILMEELDANGVPTDPEPVPESERLPFELVVRAPAGDLARQRLLELLEAVLNLESGDSEWTAAPGARRTKLPLV